MPIYGRKPDECFATFRDHVAPLVAKIITTRYPIRFERHGNTRRTLSFANDAHSDAVPIETREHGTVWLYLAQELVAAHEPKDRRYRLRTEKYWYKLYGESPSLNDDSVMRWEYSTKLRASPGECRHHMQFGKIPGRHVPFGQGSLDLTLAHMPTGWVLMEHVFRFLIHDLGMQPPCGDEWPEVLQRSEDKFFGAWTDKGGQGLTEPPTE